MTTQRIALIDRFWTKVNKHSGRFGIDGKFSTECWEWTGYTESGYGKIRDEVTQKVVFAHRVSMELHHGSIAGLCVLHKCDNRLCVNPEHLRIGTRLDNNLDMKHKGRARGMVGERHHGAKLLDDDIRTIRILAADGVVHEKIAEQFGVCRANITHIVNGRIWRHVV